MKSIKLSSINVALLILIQVSFQHGAIAQHPNSQEMRETFKSPPKDFRPMVRWWWPGGDVSDDELRREIGLMDEAGFGGAEIQPFRTGLSPNLPQSRLERVNDYLTPGFFEHVRAALDEAERRDMWLDFTFGSGWPFGGGEKVTPDLAAVELEFAQRSIVGPTKYKGKIPMPRPPSGEIAAWVAQYTGIDPEVPPRWQELLRQQQKLVAVVAVRGEEAIVDLDSRRDPLGRPEAVVEKTGMLENGTQIVLTEQVLPDGTLDWDVPAGTWQLFTFMQFPADLRVLGGIGDGPQLVIDHMKRAALDAHISAVGRGLSQHVASHFGKGLRAVFCDSFEARTDIYWTDNFLEEFRRQRGYDLTPLLFLIKHPGRESVFGSYQGLPLYDMEAIGDRVRHDYWQTVSDLLVENFFAPFGDWAAANGLKARVQAHGAPVDVLKAYGLSHIPETENLYAGGQFDFLKHASSASHVYGGDTVSSESFVWGGKLYRVTPEMIKRGADRLISAGVNQIVYHGFPYEYMDRPDPGWYPFSAPFFISSHINHRNPMWKFLAPLNAYITRLQWISRVGRTITPIAVYRGALSYETNEQQQRGADVLLRFLQNGYSSDHINADALLRSRVESGELIAPGGSTYRHLVITYQERIALELIERLSEFAKKGLPITFIGRVPDEEIGAFRYGDKTRGINSYVVAMLGVQGDSAERTGITEKGNVRFVKTVDLAVAAIRRTVDPNVGFQQDVKSTYFIQKRIGLVDAFFFWNDSNETKKLGVKFARSTATPEIWDPWTGETLPLNDFEDDDGGLRIMVELEPFGSRLIILDPQADHQLTPATKSPKTVSLDPMAIGAKTQNWRLRAGSVSIEIKRLIDWSEHPQLRHFSGDATYSIDVEIPPAYLAPDIRLILELGEVREAAEVRVNGQAGPTLLMHPFRADVTPLVHPGKNKIEVTVTNTLANRLIGEGLKVGTSYNSPDEVPQLVPSGLLGPVRLIPLSP